MLFRTVLGLVVALSVSANLIPTLLASSKNSIILARQNPVITAEQIPEACRAECATAISVYQTCSSGNEAECLSICRSGYNPQTCTGCNVSKNTARGMSSAQLSAFLETLGYLVSACSLATNQNPTGSASNFPSQSLPTLTNPFASASSAIAGPSASEGSAVSAAVPFLSFQALLLGALGVMAGAAHVV